MSESKEVGRVNVLNLAGKVRIGISIDDITVIPEILDKWIAPGVSDFTRAVIPDPAGKYPEAEDWSANFFLNSLNPIGYEYGLRQRQLVIGFLRRAQLAVAAYTAARRLTLEYLEGHNPLSPQIREYYAAVARWEHFAIESSILIDLFVHIDDGHKVFKKGDRSIEDRLYHLANKVKHIGDDIRNRGLYGTTDSIALWLSNDGLNGLDFDGTKLQVTYAEASQFLDDVARIADKIQNPRNFSQTPPAQAADEPQAQV
jgi:hypothetical protein